MTQRLTRGELYDLVWSHPTQGLAKQFGISNVALAKGGSLEREINSLNEYGEAHCGW